MRRNGALKRVMDLEAKARVKRPQKGTPPKQEPIAIRGDVEPPIRR